MIQGKWIYIVALVMVFAITVPCLAGGFDDVPSDHWAYKAVQYLHSKGVLVGDQWGKFNGDKTMSRYEFAVAIARIVALIEDFEKDGGYDVDGELKKLSDDIYAVLEELEAEFKDELDEIYEILDDHESRIGDLEKDVDILEGDIEEVANKIGKILWKADLRLRFEGIYEDDDDQVQRPRIRFRLSTEAPINDEVKMKTRLASGSSSGPTSTNQTLEDEFDKKSFWIDVAYLEWKPPGLQDWKFMGGKFGPHWKNTLITFDSDVNVEGIGQAYKNDDGFILNFAELVPDEKGFYIVAQIGKEDLIFDGADLYITYHFINEEAWQFIAQKLMDGELKNRMKLDLIDMDDYSAIDIIGELEFDASGMPIVLTGNYVLNLADDATEEKSGLQQAAYAKIEFNQAKELGDLEGWIEYGKLQANSVLSFITDADRGSGDHEFWAGGITYKWLKNLDIALTYIHSERLSTDSDYNLVHLDFLSKV